MKELTSNDRKSAFISAVTSFANARTRWETRSKSGLTDGELSAAIRYELGIAGGSSQSMGHPSVAYQGSGLKIWASWGFPNSCLDKPILEGRATMVMARDVFLIKDPDVNQLSLF